MMKPIFVAVMFFVGLVCTFADDNNKGKTTGSSPVITGGWNKIGNTEELDEVIISFVKNYLDENAQTCTGDKEAVLTIERAWTQLVRGRKYLLAYSLMPQKTDENESPDEDATLPMLGLLIVWRDINGKITVEKDYSHLALFEFVELILVAEKEHAKLLGLFMNPTILF